MKFETLLLRSLFVACLLACGLVLGGMLSASPQAVQLAANSKLGALLATPGTCMLPPDGVVCPRQDG
ncbi:hypothetical protein [Fulvimonas yonginensis]|uniref:Uncharacterized protein n=1 Tax=Fulvimonas yonginensis TaxID=1495200 RepID=A0ABU8J7B9_9GAMM